MNLFKVLPKVFVWLGYCIPQIYELFYCYSFLGFYRPYDCYGYPVA